MIAKYVIIGASAGGIGAVEAIRDVDPTGSIEVIRARVLFKRDYVDANENVSRLESYANREISILTLISNKKLEPNISALFRIILDSSRRILEYSRNIAEVTLN